MIKKIFLIIATAFLCSNVFAYNRVNTDVYKWKKYKTLHFDIFYAEGHERTALISAKYAEEGFARISKILNYSPSKVIPVIVYPSSAHFQQTNILNGKIPGNVGGFTEFMKSRVVVPYTPDHDLFKHVLIHEIVHSFQYHLLTDTKRPYRGLFNIPLWYIEGMAEYISIGYDESADLFMRDILLNDLFVDIKKFSKGHYYSGYQVYKQGQSFFYFLHEKYSDKLIRSILTDTILLNSFEDSLEKNIGKSLFDINKEWHRFYKKKYYPSLKDKNYDDEIGIKIRDHLKEGEYVYAAPSISHDGEKIAYISTGKYYYKLYVGDIEENKISNIVVIDTADLYSNDYLNLDSNNISWTSDSKKIIYVARKLNKDSIVIYDTLKKTKKNIYLPIKFISYPSISSDNKKIVFIGIVNSVADVYTYDLISKKIFRITNNFDYEESPVFSKDNKKIYFLSKKQNQKKNNVYVYYFENKKTEQITNINSSKASLLLKDKYIYFSDNREGVNNIFRINIDTYQEEKITNALTGVFNPIALDDNRIIYTAYNYMGYDIIKRNEVEPLPEGEDIFLRYSLQEYPYNYEIYSGFDDSSHLLYKDYILFMLGGTVGYGIAGTSIGSFSDMFGEHNLKYNSEFLFFDDDQKEINLSLYYSYLKYRPDFYLTANRIKNPFGIYSLESFNNFVNNRYWNIDDYTFYSASAGFSYPFTSLFALDVSINYYYYKYIYTDSSEFNDEKGQIFQIKNIFTFSNVISGLFGPVEGTELYVVYNENYQFSENPDFYRSIELFAGKYYELGNIFIVSFNASMGKYFDSKTEDFSLGGYNTLRGYSYNEFSGKQYFLTSAEVEFILIEKISTGLLPGFYIANIGGALFIDAGSAWDSNYELKKDGELYSLKVDAGYGFRMHISPEIFLKLDFAYPYDGNSFGKREIQFSITYR